MNINIKDEKKKIFILWNLDLQKQTLKLILPSFRKATFHIFYLLFSTLFLSFSSFLPLSLCFPL